jgi:hypothetical protein
MMHDGEKTCFSFAFAFAFAFASEVGDDDDLNSSLLFFITALAHFVLSSLLNVMGMLVAIQ